MRFWQKILPRTAMFGLFAFLFVLAVLVPIGFDKAEADGVSDLSLYQRASELTREFATALAPGSQVGDLWMIQDNNGGGYLPAGNAGGLLGYAEILADDEGIIGWLMNSYTVASATITYDQLMHVVDNGGDSVYDAGLRNPFFQYAGYGEVLTEMGLVSTVRPGLAETGRLIASASMLIVYLLANVAPFLFRGALFLLTTLNPFKLFETVFSGTASADLGILSSVAEYVGDIYLLVQNFSIFFLLPLLLVMAIVGVLMFRKSAPKTFGRYAVQVFMLFAGLPLVGATYTGLIEDLDSQVSVGSEYADYLILSSYVDFENWVKYSRLAPPADGDIRNPRYSEDENRSISDRALILEVNGTRANSERAETLRARYSSTSDLGEIFEEGGSREIVTGERISGEDRSSFSQVYSILARHMSSAKYTSSDYEGEVSGQIQKLRKNMGEDQEEAIVQMFSLTASDTRTWSEKLNPFGDGNKEWMKPIHWNGEDNDQGSSAYGLFTGGSASNAVFQFNGFPYNIYNAGDLTYEVGAGYTSPNTPAIVDGKLDPIGSGASEVVGGLSPIAMYNFLNTTFSNTGLTVYSPTKTSTDLSRDAYSAVTFGGSGVSAMTRWAENFVVMLCLAILSIAFGVSMISAAVNNIPRILTGVFGTALGSIAFATKLLVSTAVLLIQIIGTIFLYALSENIIMTLLLNFNEVMNVGGEYFRSGVIFEFLSSFLIIVVTVAVTWFMIKNLKVFREMMEEVVTNAISRIMSAVDTGTGGRGITATEASKGRVGADGKLTDAAKNPQPTGVMGLLGAAHGLEARQEKMAALRGKEGRSLGEKMKARASTAMDLAKAKGADKAKEAVGITGQSYDREVEAKNAMVNAMNHGDATALGKIVDDEFTANDDPVLNTTNAGQTVGDDGEVITDANGNAVDAKGNPISTAAPIGAVGTFGNRAMTANDGSLLDENGNTYTDEMGNTFYQNSKGQLVNAQGQFVALDKDGVLQPIATIPGHNGKPVTALSEAKKLDNMRFDSAKYGDMMDAQNTSHYGLDKNGHPVGANGEVLRVKGKNGQPSTAAQLDDKGYLVDNQGNRVQPSELKGAADLRGFEQVVDPATGETHLRHKGDAAMKPLVTPTALPPQGATHYGMDAKGNLVNANGEALRVKGQNGQPSTAARLDAQGFVVDAAGNRVQSSAVAGGVDMRGFKEVTDAQTGETYLQHKGNEAEITPSSNQSLTMMARQSNRASLVADRANQRLQQLKANGASPYAIMQAQRYADKANRKAQTAQTMFTQAMQASANAPAPTVDNTTQSQPVTGEHVASIARAAQVEQSKLKSEVGKLQQMKQNGEPPRVIARQERAVEQQRTIAQRATDTEQSARIAKTAQRSLGEVQSAQDRVARTEEVFNNAQQAYTQAVSSGASKSTIAKQEARMNKASKVLSESRANLERVSQPPLGSRPEIDQATARYEQAKSVHQQAINQVQELQRTGATPQEVKAAKKAQAQAQRKVVQTRQAKQQLLNPAGWSNDTTQPQVQPEPVITPTKSYATLASAGISTYDDYSQQVTKQASDLKSNQSKLKQAQQRLVSLRNSNRPQAVIQQAESQVTALKQTVDSTQAQLNDLRDNAQGLLKNGNFQPVVASRPIRKNGVTLINQMVNMGHTQAIYDKLSYQEKAGTITDAGRTQMQALGGRLNQMRKDLVSAGIREDALRDSETITTSTKHMQQSWESFVNGESVEHDA